MEGGLNVVCLCLLSFLSIAGRFQFLTFYSFFVNFYFIAFSFVVVLSLSTYFVDFLYYE